MPAPLRGITVGGLSVIGVLESDGGDKGLKQTVLFMCGAKVTYIKGKALSFKIVPPPSNPFSAVTLK